MDVCEEVIRMQKMTVRGIPLHVDDRRIVLLEGDVVCTYSRDYYRLQLERDEVLFERRAAWEKNGHEVRVSLKPAMEGR